MRAILLSLILLFACVAVPSSFSLPGGLPVASAVAGLPPPPPKLLLMIVIDQFRADYLMRFKSNFLPAVGKDGKLGGFKYLMEKGAYFPLAAHDVAQSMTAPGHATVLTGAYPYQTGIPLNHWFDRKRRQILSATFEPTLAPVGSGSGSSDSTSALDQKFSGSPKNLIGSTVGDELKNAGYSSRVFSIALKQTPAVLLGGHRADLALWYEPKSHQWISSEYYLPNKKLPLWVIDLNQKLKPHLNQNVNWSSPNWETSDQALTKSRGTPSKNNSFQHTYQIGTSDVMESPYGLELTLQAAQQAIQANQLGTGPSTDLLAVSISSHDLAGHQYGADRREMEELTYAEDKMLSELFNFVRTHVKGGLGSTVIALTGDHGIAPIPELLETQKVEAGRVDEQEITDRINSRLNEKFGKPENGNWVFVTMSFNVYFDPTVIADKKLKASTVEAEAQLVLQDDPRISHIVASSKMMGTSGSGAEAPGVHGRQIQHSFYPGRSGDLMLIFKPNYIPKGLDGSPANHVSGYSYDRTVPLLFAGAAIKPGTYATPAYAVDIAPTLSYLLSLLPPSLSEGTVLSEILK